MQRKMAVKRTLLIILAIITLFGTTVPVAAESALDSQTVSDSAVSQVQGGSSITAPLTFDGSKPDKSQVVVENVQDGSLGKMAVSGDIQKADSINSDLPQKVVTELPAVNSTDSALQLITTDKYFLYTPKGESTPVKQFYAEVSSLSVNLDTEGEYYFRLSASESDDNNNYLDVDLTSSKTMDCYFFMYTKDISNLIKDTSSLYVSVWKKDGTKLCKSTKIDVEYADDNVALASTTVFNNKEHSLPIEINVPYKEGRVNGGYISIQLVKNDGSTVVAKNKYNTGIANAILNQGFNDTDYRYDTVFRSYNKIERISDDFFSCLYPTTEITPGNYGIKIVVGDETIYYPNMVQIVDGPIIENVYALTGNGFPPPNYGGNEAYICVALYGASKDDFSINIIDENGSIIGGDVESRYISDNLNVIYKVKLSGSNVFGSGGYSVKISYNKAGNLYFRYLGNSQGFSVYSGFYIYDYSFSIDNTKAIFDFKATNHPTENIVKFGLFENSNGESKLIATADVTPSPNMENVEFKNNGVIATIKPYTHYDVKYLGGSWISLIENIYVDDSDNISNVYLFGKPYFFQNDTSYTFDFALPKSLNNITSANTYKISFKNYSGNIVGSVDGAITVEDAILTLRDGTEVSAVQLSGKYNTPSLMDGIYEVYIDIMNGTSKLSTIKIDISCLDSNKVYATDDSRSRIVMTDTNYIIDGYAYMLKKDSTYEESKFEYEMTDLFGNTVATSAVKLGSNDNTYLYEDYNIKATFNKNIPEGSYYLKLKYDGKDIYNLYDPWQLLYYEGKAIHEIASIPRADVWVSNDSGELSGTLVTGKIGNSTISALLYDSNSEITDLKSTAVIALTKDDNNPGWYCFTKESLSNIDTSIPYDIFIMYGGLPIYCYAGYYIGYNETIAVTGVSLNTSSLSLKAGDTSMLALNVIPSNATNKNVTWSSSNTSVATVNASGVVAGVAAGNADITATSLDGGFTATCKVTVTAKDNIVNPTPTQTPVVQGSVVIPSPVVPTTSPAITGTPSEKAPVIKADNSGKAIVKAAQLEKAESLTIKTEANLIFDKAALEAIKATAGDVAITVKKVDTASLSEEVKAKVGDRPVFDFSVKVGGKTISDFKGGSVKISLPYTAKENEDTNAIVVYYIDENGKLNSISGCTYDPATKTISFATTHFSKYAVGYNKVEFTDVSGWAKDYITYLSARGIIDGAGNTNFAPSKNITRGDFAIALARIAGIDINKYTNTRFSDVEAGSEYAKSIEWAAENGIVNGIGGGKFSPNAFITRQDMAVMIAKFAKAINYRLSATAEQIDFADEASIASYATDAAKTVQLAGIINGKSFSDKKGSFFAPTDNATRAEAAKMLTVIIKGMSK